MFETEWTLKPLISGYSKIEFPNKKIGTPYMEQVLISDGDWPFAVVNIDTWCPKDTHDDDVYDAIKQGRKVKVTVKFTIIDENN